jgi:hypothetical protein
MKDNHSAPLKQRRVFNRTGMFVAQEMHTYEVRPREDHRGVNLISDMLPFGRLLYLEVREAVDYAKFYSRSHHAVIRVYDAAGNVIETHEHAGEFAESCMLYT